MKLQSMVIYNARLKNTLWTIPLRREGVPRHKSKCPQDSISARSI